MISYNIAALINLLGWTMGAALYAMLLWMWLRSGGREVVRISRIGEPARGFSFLPLATAVLGLVWNTGAVATFGLHDLGVAGSLALPFLLLAATSLAALGFLPAVVVHSAVQNLQTYRNERRAHALTTAAYMLSAFAGVMHFHSALATRSPASHTALQLLTVGFALLMGGLFLLTRGIPGWRRAVWATALAVFAVSALHLSRPGSSHEAWYTELVGHHASLPLALAILYQDYRFAFADIFLKRALALLALVALVTGAFSLYVCAFASPLAIDVTDATHSVRDVAALRAVGVLLALWVATALLYPWLHRATQWFVDRIILRRANYAEMRAEIVRLVDQYERVEPLLDSICQRLASALTAREVGWREAKQRAEEEEQGVNQSTDAWSDTLLSNAVSRPVKRADGRDRRTSFVVAVPTSEVPAYEIEIRELAGGRRLLSDDVEMLESVAITVARRIDALRVTHERCEQMQREQEIAKLATEAQLRALRAQINPHFLFNALTTIGYLIQTSPERAFDTLLRLTDLLRRVLRSTAEWSTLGEELKLTCAYLDIERARFEERLRVHIDVPPELHVLPAPSLVVQPLVENAVKHGIAPQRTGGEVIISARLVDAAYEETPKLLCITVRDTGAGASELTLAEGRRKGVGLANVEQRLRLCCGDSATLRIESTPGFGATVELSLPLRSIRSPAPPPSRTHHPSENSFVNSTGAAVTLAAKRVGE